MKRRTDGQTSEKSDVMVEEGRAESQEEQWNSGMWRKNMMATIVGFMVYVLGLMIGIAIYVCSFWVEDRMWFLGFWQVLPCMAALMAVWGIKVRYQHGMEIGLGLLRAGAGVCLTYSSAMLSVLLIRWVLENALSGFSEQAWFIDRYQFLCPLFLCPLCSVPLGIVPWFLKDSKKGRMLLLLVIAVTIAVGCYSYVSFLEWYQNIYNRIVI